MSRTRHDGILARTLSVRYAAGFALEPHTHAWHQLIYASDGVMSVESEGGAWIVPPQRAAWVPAGIEHSITMCGPVELRTVYLPPDAGDELPPTCCVASVTPLLRELILHVASLGMLREATASHVRLAAVLVDLVVAIEAAPYHLQMPKDARARRIADLLHEDPSRRGTIDAFAKRAGASPRTLERIFHEETGLSFGRWRQNLRLIRATQRLGRGEPVTAVALDVGYESTSAFITAFRKAFGVTPGKYFAAP